MFSDNPSILQLVALLKAHRVSHVVACPGSRNAPIIHSLANEPFFTLHPVTDERSAGFFALGVALAKREAVAVCCTSGTALLNLHPAVAEAFYQKVPLVVISADRPAAWIGQQDGQTLPQPGVFGSLVKMSVSLPEGNSAENRWHRNRLINEALLETNHHGRGPVHINVPLGEPLFEYHTEQLPRERLIKRKYEILFRRPLPYTKRLLVVGQYEALLGSETVAPYVCLSEYLGNVLIELTSYNFDTILSRLTEEEEQELVPELLITVGGHIVSKRLKQFLRKHPPREHWHVAEDGAVADTFQSVTTVWEMKPSEFLFDMGFYFPPLDSKYAALWKRHSEAIPEPKFPYSGMAAVGELMSRLPEYCTLHLANSSAVRYAQMFPFKPEIEIFCNRGTSGIEGSLSTAVGYASINPWNKLHFLLIGDLSFFYDMNALCIEPFPPNLRIMLLNNGGGGIFQRVKGMVLTPKTEPLIAAKRPVISAKEWAEARGLEYFCATDKASLDQAMPFFMDEQKCLLPHPMLLEVMTDAETDVQLLNDYYQSLKKQ